MIARALTAITLTALGGPSSAVDVSSLSIQPLPALFSLPRLQFGVAASAQQLDAICALSENWDGYGGAPLHPETQRHVRAAVGAFQLYGPIPELTPNPNGTVSFEWTSDRGDAHVEVGRTRYVGMIRPTGSEHIPVVGTTDGDLATAMYSLAHVIKGALFPVEPPALTSIRLPVDNVLSAA